MNAIKKILIANRGEIAIRVMRTARDMGIRTVAVYSDADREALFVRMADEAVCIGGTHASESYLVQDKVIAAARLSGADAIHPGYGFLSENASFSQRCADEGIIFIGPSAAAITAMGSKIGAKELMKKAGVPVVPGYNGADQSIETLQREAAAIGYPILLKASAGGGGKGMRIVNKAEELGAAVEGASREAAKSFGDGTLLMEKYFPSAKHIEFQIFGDQHGRYTHFYDRECSLQRRYQKVIEESPSPSLTDDLRRQMGEAAVAAARSIGYYNAGTVEFILDGSGQFYFLEVNTRLQVEHPVTEQTTGLDLVRLQIEVAQGLPLSASSESVRQHGHAIECRICAEDPENNFFPSTGQVLYWYEPQLTGIRYDSGVVSGSRVDVFYDSLISKVISTGTTRAEAIRRMVYALDQMVVLGLTTNKDFLKELLLNPSFTDGSFDTRLIEREYTGYRREASQEARWRSAVAAMLYTWQQRRQGEAFAHALNGWRNISYEPQSFVADYAGEKLAIRYEYAGDSRFEVFAADTVRDVLLVHTDAHTVTCVIDGYRQSYHMAVAAGEFFVQSAADGTFRFREVPRFAEPGAALAAGGYTAPMPGEVIKVLVQPGDKVQAGKGLLVMSSMKMETTIEAHTEGEVEEVYVADKQFVEAQTVLLKMKD